MDTIQRTYEQSPKRNTFVFRHRAGTAVILPLLGLLLGVLAIALALTDVSLWWLAVVVAVPVGIVDEARAARRHSGLGVGRLYEEPERKGARMPIAERTAEVIWDGSLARGRGPSNRVAVLPSSKRLPPPPSTGRNTSSRPSEVRRPSRDPLTDESRRRRSRKAARSRPGRPESVQRPSISPPTYFNDSPADELPRILDVLLMPRRAATISLSERYKVSG